MRVIRVGEKYSVAGGEVQTYDRLPAQTYVVRHSEEEGMSLKKHPNIGVDEKVYGVLEQKAEKVLGSFEIFERSLGIILSGDKGIGKSVFARMICQRAVESGYPVIIVDEAHREVPRFIESSEQECVVLFDEFDKTFTSNVLCDEQEMLLSLFDGTACGKKMFIVTCNNWRSLNEHIVNRPGRFHYHFRFEYPTAEEIQEYLEDKIEQKYYDQIEKVIEFSGRVKLNYDCLRAIAFELNQGFAFAEAIKELNILNIEMQVYHVYLQYENGENLYCSYYRANLFKETEERYITFSDRRGEAKVDVAFTSEHMVYDKKTHAVIIPGEHLKLDYYCEDLKKIPVSCLKFVKSEPENLHYVI